MRHPGYPKNEKWAPRDELKNGHGRGWAVLIEAVSSFFWRQTHYIHKKSGGINFGLIT